MTDDKDPPAFLQARLANERTLLAWLRTAVALMGFGLMVARLGVFLDTLARATHDLHRAAGQSRWTGAALLITGSIVAIIGYHRVRAYAKVIDPYRRPPGDRGLYFTAALVILLGVGLATFVVIMY
jgi:putative membrane protein